MLKGGQQFSCSLFLLSCRAGMGNWLREVTGEALDGCLEAGLNGFRRPSASEISALRGGAALDQNQN